MPPDEDQNQTAPGAAPTQEQPQTSPLGQPVSQEPPGQFTPPAPGTPITPQEPVVPAFEPGPSFAPGPTMPGPTMPGPIFPPSSPPMTPTPPTPDFVVGSAPKSGGNTMQKIRLLLILVPILVLLVIVIFVATSFLGKVRSRKGVETTPTPTTGAFQPPSPPTVSPGGFGQIPTSTPALAGGIYRDPTYGFSIEPPSGWVQEKGTGLVTFKNPTEDLDASGNKFNANILITAATLSAGQTFDSFIEQSKRELTILFGYQKISEVKGILAGQPAFQIDIAWKLGAHEVKQRVVLISQGTNVFQLTATSTAVTWDKYQPLFEKSISSFTFTGPSI